MTESYEQCNRLDDDGNDIVRNGRDGGRTQRGIRRDQRVVEPGWKKGTKKTEEVGLGEKKAKRLSARQHERWR